MQDEGHVFELLPGYALDSLDDDDAARVASHLAACHLCRAELLTFQEVTAALALPSPEPPPADAKRRLMDRVQGLPPAKPASQPAARGTRRPLVQRLLPVWGIASLLLIAGLATISIMLWGRVNSTQTYTSPSGMRAIAVKSNPAKAPYGSAIVIISADGENGVLVVDELPQLDASHQYQIWLTHDQEITRGPAFTVDATGYRGTRIVAPASLLSYQEIYVTIELLDSTPITMTGETVVSGSLHNNGW